MKTKLSHLLNTKKRKSIAIIAIVALMLSVSAFTAMAANDGNLPSLVRSQNGNVSYSNDGGDTWIDGKPAGFNSVTDEDGRVRSWVGSDEPPADDNAVAAKYEDGRMTYSNDGGKTWTDESPGSVTVEDDGKVTIERKSENAKPSGKGPMLTRNEKGNVSYSTDGGKTWTNETPDGYNSVTDENGHTRSWFGDKEPNLDGATVISDNNKEI